MLFMKGSMDTSAADSVFFIHIHINKLIRLSQCSHISAVYYDFLTLMIGGKKSSHKSQMDRGMRTVMYVLFGRITLSGKAAIIRSFYKKCKSSLISCSPIFSFIITTH